MNRKMETKTSEIIEIEKYLNRKGVDNYIISDDEFIHVLDDIDVSFGKDKQFPYNFGFVRSNFYCNTNMFAAVEKLTTLVGAPEYVGGEFDCSYNDLTTLEGCPRIVQGDFYCHGNKIRTLEFCPDKVGGCFVIDIQFSPLEILYPLFEKGYDLDKLRFEPGYTPDIKTLHRQWTINNVLNE